MITEAIQATELSHMQSMEKQAKECDTYIQTDTHTHTHTHIEREIDIYRYIDIYICVSITTGNKKECF